MSSTKRQEGINAYFTLPIWVETFARLVCFESPDEIYILNEGSLPLLIEIVRGIEDVLSSLEQLDESDLKVGSYCLSPSDLRFDSKTNWNRAQIIMIDGNQVQIQLLDYGVKNLFLKSHIKKLPESLFFKKLAHKVSLLNIEPKGTTWSKECIDSLKKITNRQSFTPCKICLEKEVASGYYNGIIKIKIQNQWENLSHWLIDNGYAIESTSTRKEKKSLDKEKILNGSNGSNKHCLSSTKSPDIKKHLILGKRNSIQTASEASQSDNDSEKNAGNNCQQNYERQSSDASLSNSTSSLSLDEYNEYILNKNLKKGEDLQENIKSQVEINKEDNDLDSDITNNLSSKELESEIKLRLKANFRSDEFDNNMHWNNINKRTFDEGYYRWQNLLKDFSPEQSRSEHNVWKLKIKNIEIKEKKDEIFITGFYSHNLLSLMTKSGHDNHLLRIIDEAESFVADLSTNEKIAHPHLGDIVCTRNSTWNNLLFRCAIVATLPDDNLLLDYIDIGKQEICSSSCIYPVNNEIIEHPVLSIEAKLDKISQNEPLLWMEDFKKFFSKSLFKKNVFLNKDCIKNLLDKMEVNLSTNTLNINSAINNLQIWEWENEYLRGNGDELSLSKKFTDKFSAFPVSEVPRKYSFSGTIVRLNSRSVPNQGQRCLTFALTDCNFLYYKEAKRVLESQIERITSKVKGTPYFPSNMELHLVKIENDSEGFAHLCNKWLRAIRDEQEINLLDEEITIPIDTESLHFKRLCLNLFRIPELSISCTLKNTFKKFDEDFDKDLFKFLRHGKRILVKVSSILNENEDPIFVVECPEYNSEI